MSLHWKLVLFYLFLLSCTARAKQFYLIPSGSTSCPSDPCYSLTDVIQNPSQYFVSNTAIKFLPGHHRTNITKDISVLIKDVKNISMIGYDRTNYSSNSVIHCTGSLGFAFINVTMLAIAKLRFAFCGAHFSFPVEEKFVYLDDFVTKLHFTNESKVTFYFLQTINVTISEVNINNSSGAGLLGINMLGYSKISQTIFTGNRPNCLILFLDIPSASQTFPSTIFTIENSHVSFGKLPNHSHWGATGLGIALAQSTYYVHVLVSNIEACNNMKTSNWYGNLHFVIENWECQCSVIQGKRIASINMVEKKDKTGIDLNPKTSSDPCNCSKPAEEEYTVQLSDSYFVGWA